MYSKTNITFWWSVPSMKIYVTIFIPENMITNVSLNKFYQFLTSKNELIITSLAKYLFYAFKKHKLLLEG